MADPALAALLDAELGPAGRVDVDGGTAATCTLADLGLGVADVVLHHQAELDALAAAVLGADARRRDGRAAGAPTSIGCVRSSARRTGCPEIAGGPEAGVGRAARPAGGPARRAPPISPPRSPPTRPTSTAARRWGLPADGAADVLADRLARAGDALTDATADAATAGGADPRPARPGVRPAADLHRPSCRR